MFCTLDSQSTAIDANKYTWENLRTVLTVTAQTDTTFTCSAVMEFETYAQTVHLNVVGKLFLVRFYKLHLFSSML